MVQYRSTTLKVRSISIYNINSLFMAGHTLLIHAYSPSDGISYLLQAFQKDFIVMNTRLPVQDANIYFEIIIGCSFTYHPYNIIPTFQFFGYMKVRHPMILMLSALDFCPRSPAESDLTIDVKKAHKENLGLASFSKHRKNIISLNKISFQIVSNSKTSNTVALQVLY